eukprot:jgi/Mesvir1/20903/Mv07977-RA.1
MIPSLTEFASQLENRLKAGSLPGPVAHIALAPLARAPQLRQAPPDDARKSAVLILLYERGVDARDTAVLTCLMRRTEGGSHSGQICFPGGRVEPGDPDLVHTALREAEEELGIPRGDVVVLGHLSDIYIPPSNFLVRPVVGYLRNGAPKFVPAPSEVAEVLEVAVDTLLGQHSRSFRRPSAHGKDGVMEDATEVQLTPQLRQVDTRLRDGRVITLEVPAYTVTRDRGRDMDRNEDLDRDTGRDRDAAGTAILLGDLDRSGKAKVTLEPGIDAAVAVDGTDRVAGVARGDVRGPGADTAVMGVLDGKHGRAVAAAEGRSESGADAEYVSAGEESEHVVWGATAMMLSELMYLVQEMSLPGGPGGTKALL